jgi:hypothetical protein
LALVAVLRWEILLGDFVATESGWGAGTISASSGLRSLSSTRLGLMAEANLSRTRRVARIFDRGLDQAIFRFAAVRQGLAALGLRTFFRLVVVRGFLRAAVAILTAWARRGALRFAPVPAFFRFTRATARFMTDYRLRLGWLLGSCNGNSLYIQSFFALDSATGCD